MTLKSSLTPVTLFTAFDPYDVDTDNRPLSQLSGRDDAIADELDKRTQIIDITGAASPTINAGPTGWTVTRNGVGDYTIIHALNNTNARIIGTCNNTTPVVLFQYASTANTISVKTVNLSGAATDCRFACSISG